MYIYIHIYIYIYTHTNTTPWSVFMGHLYCVVYRSTWTHHLLCYYNQNDTPVDVHGAALLSYLSLIYCYYDNYIVCFIIHYLFIIITIIILCFSSFIISSSMYCHYNYCKGVQYRIIVRVSNTGWQEDSWDALSCRSFFAKEPLIIGPVCGK